MLDHPNCVQPYWLIQSRCQYYGLSKGSPSSGSAKEPTTGSKPALKLCLRCSNTAAAAEVKVTLVPDLAAPAYADGVCTPVQCMCGYVWVCRHSV
jgi:hypothetical protein